MSREEQGRSSNKVYYSVVGGTFRRRVSETTAGAIARINKNDKQVFELEVPALVGKIEAIAFEDSDYGKQIKITLDANEHGMHPVLTFGVESKDGRDILRKLPAINLEQEVRIAPFSFTPEGETEKRTGITVSQPDEEGNFTRKIDGYFYDKDTNTYLHGFPTIDWETASETKKKIYKIERDEFLVNYTQEHVIPKLLNEPLTANDVAPTPSKYEDDPLDQIPF